MSRLIATLILAMLIIPCTGAVFLLLVFLFIGVSSGPPPSVLDVIWIWGLTYLFVAAYWIRLWYGHVRWTRSRVLWTVASGPISLVLGQSLIFLLDEVTPAVELSYLVGGGFIPILWVLATVLIWRETPAERLARMAMLGRQAVCCPICGYNMTGLTEVRCPECGSSFTLDQLALAQPERDGTGLRKE